MLSIAFIAPVLVPTNIRHIKSFRSSSIRTFSPLQPRPTRPKYALCVSSSLADPIQDTSSNQLPKNGALSHLSASDISLATSHPPSFSLQAADVFMLCIFCAGCLYPAIRSQEAAVRTRALLSGGIIFSVHTILYLLRMRSVQRRFRDQLSASYRIESHLNNDDFNRGENIRSALAGERTYLDDSFSEIRAVIYDVAGKSERKNDKLHAEVMRGMRGDVDELRAGLDIVRQNLAKLNSDEVTHLRNMLMQRERTIVQLETKLTAIKSDLETAGAREESLRVEIDTLKAAAGDVSGLHERLLAAQTRTATLEERLLSAQDSALSSSSTDNDNSNANLQLQQIPGTKALREALLNLGKSFPPAGKLLFDPPTDDTAEMDRRSILSSSSQTLQQDPLNWPQAPLGRDDMGLPKDGGFGTNHFSDSSAGENASAEKDPFSALRGAFNEDSSGVLTAVEDKPAESEEPMLEEYEAPFKQERNVAVESPVDIETSNTVVDREKSTAEAGNEGAVGAEAMKSSNGETETDASSSTGSYLESLRKDTAAFEKADVSGLEMRLVKARELVKRARRGDAGEAVRSFSSALELLEAAPTGGPRVDAEIGSILLAWARRDIAADGSKSRLQRAADLLRNIVDENEDTSGVRFNLALTLCMLASLEESPACEKLYEEACGHYDTFGTESSRTVCFNSGLAYISRARLAEAANGNDNNNSNKDATDMYRKAEKLFLAALQFSADDNKSKTYLEECRAKLKEAEKESE